MTLTCPRCNGSVVIINDNGVTDPEDGDRWEKYECSECGNTFTKVLRA